jgi:hypothetical protein
MKLIVAPEAEAQLLLRQRWWRAHRPKAPTRFEEELTQAMGRIAASPAAFPVYAVIGERTIRRCLLVRTHCHLYFEERPSTDEVWIVAAAGAARRKGPRLPPR